MIQDKRLKPCPFCGKVPSIYVCDNEGNIHDDSYQDNPWSGLSYSICHEYIEDKDYVCPVATFEREVMGTQMYDTIDELVERWNKRI